MFFYVCSICGASAYSAANASTVGACPRCSRPLVQHEALAHVTGRGPTQARTTLGEDGVFVVLQNGLREGRHE